MMDLMSAAKLNPAQALTSMLGVLAEIRDQIKGLRNDKPPEREFARTQWYIISSASGRQQVTLPGDFSLTGLMLMGDTAGRATLNVGTELYPFSVPQDFTLYLPLSMEDRLVIKNTAVSYTPPFGTTVWDVVLIGHNR